MSILDTANHVWLKDDKKKGLHVLLFPLLFLLLFDFRERTRKTLRTHIDFVFDLSVAPEKSCIGLCPFVTRLRVLESRA